MSHNIRFRAWDKINKKFAHGFVMHEDGKVWTNKADGDDVVLLQFTGLLDRNEVLTEIYEGDIIDEKGIKRGNIYETPDRQATDLIITGMGTATWRDTEQKAMERGCRYSE